MAPLTHAEIDNLIEMSDPDGVYIMLQDLGDFDGLDYIEREYF